MAPFERRRDDLGGRGDGHIVHDRFDTEVAQS